MISETRIKVRALIEDLSQADYEVFNYRGISVFTLSEPNVNSVVEVLQNGSALGSGDYSYDSDFHELTVTASMSDGDDIQVNYTFYKYSDTELNEFIRSSLVYINIYYGSNLKYDVSEIVPTPTDAESDLIALVASILIKPNYLEYKLPNIMVKYPEKYSKDEKIKNIVNTYKSSGLNGVGITDIIEYTKVTECHENI